MKFTFEIDSDKHSADVIGEYLREWSGFGGQYGTFAGIDEKPGWKSIPLDVKYFYPKWENAETYFIEEAIKPTCALHEETGISCAYFMDGDGYVVFRLPEGLIVENDDSKKSYEWRYVND